MSQFAPNEARAPRPRPSFGAPASPVAATVEVSRDVRAAREAVRRAAEDVEARRAVWEREARSGYKSGSKNAEAALDRAKRELGVKEAALDAAIAAERGRSAGAVAQQLAFGPGAVAAGMAAGYGLSRAIEGRHQASVSARNSQLRTVAADVDKALRRAPSAARTAKLTGLVAAADALKLGRQRGPHGLILAGVLGAEAAYLRFGLGQDLENEAARDVTRAAGLGLGFAATGMVAERVIQEATQRRIVDGPALARVEEARRVAQLPVAGRATRPTNVAAKAPATRVVGSADLKALSHKEVYALAQQRGVAGRSKMSKPELVRALQANLSGRKAPKIGGKVGALAAVGLAAASAGASLFGGRAHANEAAAESASSRRASPGRAAARRAAGDRRSYRTVEGRKVQATRAEARAWSRRRKR